MPYPTDHSALVRIEAEQISERQRLAMPFFITCRNVEEACAEARISPITYYEWMKQPGFKAGITAMRDQVVDEAIDTLKSAMTDAVCTLIDVMHDSESEKNKIQAANNIIDHFRKFKEVQELEQKINELEELIMGKAPQLKKIEAQPIIIQDLSVKDQKPESSEHV